MKKIFSIVAVIAVAMMVGACSFSMDSIKYANGTDKEVQIAECIVSVEAPAPVAVAKATKIKIMEPVLFDFDKSNIRADQQVVIDKVAALMDEYPDTMLGIDAFASKEGPEKYNLALSQRRADSVKAALIAKGISADRIVSAVGKGETGIFGDILKLNRRAILLSVE